MHKKVLFLKTKCFYTSFFYWCPFLILSLNWNAPKILRLSVAIVAFLKKEVCAVFCETFITVAYVHVKKTKDHRLPMPQRRWPC